MGKIDFGTIRDGFFSRFFAFASSKGGIFGSWILIGLIFYLLKIDIVKNFGWILLISILLLAGLFVIRLKYFRAIPMGHSKSQVLDEWELEKRTKKIPDIFSRKYWLLVLCGVCGVVGFGITFNNQNMYTLIPVIVIFSFLIFVAWNSGGSKRFV